MRRLTIIPLALLLISCEISSPKTTAITLLADRTDPVITKPSLNDIHPFLDLKANPNTGVEITLQNIGHVDYNPLYRKHLKGSTLLENALQRQTDIKRFYTALDTMITQANTRIYNYQSSSIIVPLVRQLDILSRSKNTNKIVILYSDLAEFSDFFNIYDYSSHLKLQEQPLTVARLFKSKLSIPKLHTVHLHIIYYPKTTPQNRTFHSMLQVYREVFKESGLNIHVGLDQLLN